MAELVSINITYFLVEHMKATINKLQLSYAKLRTRILAIIVKLSLKTELAFFPFPPAAALLEYK